MPSRGWGTGAAVAAALVIVLGSGLMGCGSDGDGDSGDGGAASPTREPAGGASGDGDGATDTTLDPNCDGRGWSDAEPTSSVDVAMAEYTLTAAPEEVPAGTVELVAANDGSLFHELVVVRWDGDSGALPLNDAGGADQVRFRDDEVGRIFDFVAGTTCTARFDLEPGTYALICNLVDDGFNPHYSQGMFTTLTVT